MVSWISDRVQNLRETLGITSPMFIEITFVLFSIEKVLVPVAGHTLKATVTWWAVPSRLGTRPKPTAKDWEELWWRSTVKKKTSLYWSWLTSALRHCVRFGWHWSGTRKEKRLSGLTTQFRHSRNGLQAEPNGNAHEPCSNFWTRENPPGINGHWNDLSCWNQNVPCGIVCKRLP